MAAQPLFIFAFLPALYTFWHHIIDYQLFGVCKQLLKIVALPSTRIYNGGLFVTKAHGFSLLRDLSFRVTTGRIFTRTDCSSALPCLLALPA